MLNSGSKNRFIKSRAIISLENLKMPTIELHRYKLKCYALMLDIWQIVTIGHFVAFLMPYMPNILNASAFYLSY